MKGGVAIVVFGSEKIVCRVRRQKPTHDTFFCRREGGMREGRVRKHTESNYNAMVDCIANVSHAFEEPKHVTGSEKKDHLTVIQFLAIKGGCHSLHAQI